MERSNVDRMYPHIEGIRRNYPDWPSTFSKCSTEECRNLGRGAGMCAYCHEKKLAEFVGEDLAKEFHNSVHQEITVIAKMFDVARDKE